MNKFKKHNITSLLITLLVFNYLLNYFILNSDFEYFADIPQLHRASFLILILLFGFLLNYFFKKQIKFSEVNWYALIFFGYSLFLYNKIDPAYFWTSIPDARTYEKLGSSLLSCFKLALSCNSDPYLIFPIGQPLISGVLSKFLYNHAYFINVFMMTFVIFSFSIITKSFYKSFSGIGIFFLLSHSLIFELTPMQISEVSFTFFIFLSIVVYVKKVKNFKILSPLLYSFALLIRPIGIALFPLFIFIFKAKKIAYGFLFLVLLSAGIFNLLTSDEFVISDFNIDSREDGIIQNTGYINYFYTILKSDQEVQSEFISFFNNNYQRLYGESSKDCSFKEVCYSYNPKYNIGGTESSFFNNSNIGRIIKGYMIFFFDLTTPQRFGIFVLPIVLLISLLFRKFRVEKFLSIAVLLLIFPSLLTLEYGNRWNFTILFLTSLLIEMISSNMMFRNRHK